ncbi:MAG: hypothetical protein KF745_07080 [Phycisphaeraceae bacterium]|nr:hypothetical protein [Phycisphaeraceae bacterium]
MNAPAAHPRESAPAPRTRQLHDARRAALESLTRLAADTTNPREARLAAEAILAIDDDIFDSDSEFEPAPAPPKPADLKPTNPRSPAPDSPDPRDLPAPAAEPPRARPTPHPTQSLADLIANRLDPLRASLPGESLQLTQRAGTLSRLDRAAPPSSGRPATGSPASR